MRTLTIALCIVLIGAPLAAATKCMDDCTQFKIEVPPKPESGYNTGKAVSAILDGFLTVVRAKTDTFGANWNAFGYIGGGIFGGLWGATVEAQEPAKMDEYNLAKGLQSTQDYLSCVMEAQVSNAVYDLNQRMDNDKIDAFNNAIQGIVDYMGDNCVAHNCLNASTVEPSKRNDYVGATCVTPYRTEVDGQCANVTWNPLSPTLCNGVNADGAVLQGVCGVDGMCYHTDVGFIGTAKAYMALRDQFMSHPSINGFNAFNTLRNPTAVVAYAKGALVYLSILQELQLLGYAGAQDATAAAFAKRATLWLQDRVQYHTNVSTALLTVLDANSDNPYNQEPLKLRKSCKPGDLYTTELWSGCSKVGSGFKADTTFCLFKPNGLGVPHKEHLCMGVCNDDTQTTNAGFRAKRADIMYKRTLGNMQFGAASEMAAANRQLFTNSGIYSIISNLAELSSKAMPDGSRDFYQLHFTPKWLCKAPSQRPLLRKATGGVAPLTAWEEADNLSQGSVVVRGVVIGGNKTAPPQKAAPAPAPAKAKATGRRLLDA